MVARERAEALERQRLAEYIVWRKREDFQERRGEREKRDRSAEKGKEAAAEVIWKKREEDNAVREPTKAYYGGPQIVWRKKERE